jgi:hypothetical protein
MTIRKLILIDFLREGIFKREYKVSAQSIQLLKRKEKKKTELSKL